MATAKDAATETDDWKSKFINETRAKEKEIAKVKQKFDAATLKRKELKDELDDLNEELHAIIRGGPDRESQLNFPEPWNEKHISILKLDAKTQDAIALLRDEFPIETVGQLHAKMKEEGIDLSTWFTDRQITKIDGAIDAAKIQFPEKS